MTYAKPPSPPLNYGYPPAGDSWLGRLIAWAVIIASVVTLTWMNYRDTQKTVAMAAMAKPGFQVELLGRYAVGLHTLLVTTNKPDTSSKTIIPQFDSVVESPADKLAVVTVVAEVEGKSAALSRLGALRGSLPGSLLPEADALRQTYTVGPSALTADQRAGLTEHLDWFGRLALTFELPKENPQRATILSSARQTIYAAVGFLLVAGLMLLAGLILFFAMIVLLAGNNLQRAYRATAPTAGGGLFLEAFAIYLGGMTAGFLVAGHLPHALQKNLLTHIGLMIGPTILAIFWPLIRGENPAAWRGALGWHRGRGLFREMGLGLVGYLAGMPLLAIAFFITSKLSSAVHAHPSHPVEHMIGVSPQLTLVVFVLASIWAPLTEETMFRGAFFHALRTRWGWILSALVSSFVFAAIHPQGWTAIPVLMTIAIILAGIREWRGTIFSSAAAHCLNNTIALLAATFMMS
jgi:hypothetical protein